MSNEQIVFAPNIYMDRLRMTYVGNTTLTVGSGACRDVSNQFDIILNATTTCNLAANGVNGLDSGTLAASSLYSIYAIGNSLLNSPSAILASLTSNAVPTLPFTYDSYRLLGYISTDSSSHILPFKQYGASKDRTMYYTQEQGPVLNAGIATSFTTISLAPYVPAVNCEVYAQLQVTGSTLGTASISQPAAGVNFLTTGNQVTGVVLIEPSVVIPVTSATVSSVLVGALDYKVSAATVNLSIFIQGFKYIV